MTTERQALLSCHGSNAACSLAFKPDGVVAYRRHGPSQDSSSRLASGLDGSAIKRHFNPDATPAACQTWGVESENRLQRGQFLPDLQAHSQTMGQKAGGKSSTAVDLQPTTPKPDSLREARTRRHRQAPWVAGAGLGLALLPLAAHAQSASLPLVMAQGTGGASYSVPIQTLLFFTALSFIPAVLLLMTSFTRIVIVLSLLRQAIGTQAAPPNQVIVGLSLFMTLFVMGPTLDKVYAKAYQPYNAGQINFEQALEQGEKPLREFMLKQTRQSDLSLFSKLAKLDPSIAMADVPFKVLVPSFVTSELKSAFQIGFMIFIPFLIIDMIVASVLMSLGMMMLSPVLVALPFKLMLFVLADGWNLLLGSLAASFAT